MLEKYKFEVQKTLKITIDIRINQYVANRRKFSI